VSPLLASLLASSPNALLPCRIILTERDLDEVLDSQDLMLARRKQDIVSTPERRRMLKNEYARTTARLKAMLSARPLTLVLTIHYRDAVANPRAVAEHLNAFLGGGLDVAKMAASVDPGLHRNRGNLQ